MGQGFTFELTGGALCLDFVNTLEHRGEPGREQEHLHAYADLLDWCRQARVLPRPHLVRLRGRALRSQWRAKAVLRRAVILREALYRIFSAVAAGRNATEGDLKLLDAFAAATSAKQRLLLRYGRLRWEWRKPDADLHAPLWPVVRSAVELLTSARCAAVRECAAPDCAWLFLDHSRNRSRRWCDMSVCGNRAKARRFYRRTRKT